MSPKVGGREFSGKMIQYKRMPKKSSIKERRERSSLTADMVGALLYGFIGFEQFVRSAEPCLGSVACGFIDGKFT